MSAGQSGALLPGSTGTGLGEAPLGKGARASSGAIQLPGDLIHAILGAALLYGATVLALTSFPPAFAKATGQVRR